jgi:D-glycero-D-manno-heptose 1,7-bisphosphate phosphatase
MNGERRAVFLDRDGVINENWPGYVKSWEEMEFLPGALEALRALAQSDFLIVVTTNQSAIGRGLMPPQAVDRIHRLLRETVEGHGGRLDAIYVCPHAPEDGCQCRKPAPGLLLAAAADLGLSLARSYLVGDALSDIQAAQAVSATGILVMTGRGREQVKQPPPAGLQPYHVAEDLAGAVDLIQELEAEGKETD